MGSDAESVTGYRAEDYETEESNRHVITHEEERAKHLVHLISFSTLMSHQTLLTLKPKAHERTLVISRDQGCEGMPEGRLEVQDTEGVVWLTVQKSCEAIEEEEGAEAEEAADDAGPSGEAADEAAPSQAPAAAQKGKPEMWCPFVTCLAEDHEYWLFATDL